MNQFEPSEEFKTRMRAKMEALRNQPPVEDKHVTFDELPWENPENFDGDFKDGDQHFIRYGKMGIAIQVNTVFGYGTMVAVFSDEDKEFNEYQEKYNNLTVSSNRGLSEDGKIIRDGAFCMGSKMDNPDDDPRVFYFGGLSTNYTPKHLFFVADGKSASNSALRDQYFLPYWIKEGLLPEWVMKYIPTTNNSNL